MTAAVPILEPGRVYRTRELATWSANAPRLARRLVDEGALVPLAHGLFERFSEDLDLKVEPGSVTALPAASIDNAWRGASLRAAYPRMYPGELRPRSRTKTS
jgi:hypothetical protein